MRLKGGLFPLLALDVLENMLPMGMFVRRKKCVVIYRVYFVITIPGLCIVRAIKYRKVKWAEHIACIGERGN
jgi:hypothetical protein